jgi:DNA-binding transcriptional MerR regulator
MPYSTSEAARRAGVSGGTIRNLTSGRFAEHYTGLFSPSASPGKGAARLFTEEDIATLAYIRSRTAAGVAHAQVAEELHAGALAGFAMPEGLPSSEEAPAAAAPAAAAPAAAAPAPPASTALAVADQNAALMSLAAELAAGITGAMRQQLENTRADLQAAHNEAQALAAELRASEARAAAAEARAQELAAQVAALRRPWWARLFGR